MASLHKQAGDRPGFKLRFRDQTGRQRVLWLGQVSKRTADAFAKHVAELVRAASLNLRPDGDTEKWGNDLDGRHRDRLVALGLVAPQTSQGKSIDGAISLDDYLTQYIDGRTDCKPTTIINFKQTKRLLVEFFKADCPLRGITEADSDRWRRWLVARPMAVATVSKHIKRTKTMFSEAVRDRVLRESPFADQRGGKESNKARHYFVTRAISNAVLEHCPDHDWRLIFALTRFGGFRCPSEVTALKWSDVLWDVNKLRIDSPKTGLRYCPIFPELRPILDAAYHDAPEGATFCVQRYRASANLGTQLKRIIKNAAQKPWPKLFVNLRSTRRTELQECFPSHVVDDWLGHSSKTAEEHYLQVTSDHWDLGACLETGGNAGGNIPANPQAFTVTRNEKIPENHVRAGSRFSGILRSMTPMGVEPMLPP